MFTHGDIINIPGSLDDDWLAVFSYFTLVIDYTAQPTVTITATDSSAAEPANNGYFTVSRTGDTSSSLTVYYGTSGSTATSGSDYAALPGSVNIPSGQSSALISVVVIDDSQYESSETVNVTLSSNSAYNIGSPSNATVTIIDNELVPVLSVIPDSRTVSANSGTTSFTVNNTGSGTMPWTASIISGGNWLSITSGSSGTISAEFSANDTGSSRTGIIRITASGASGSPKDVTVIQSSSDSNDQCNYAYIPNTNSNTVSVIDTSTNIVVDTINVGSVPYGVAVNPLGTRVYITNQGDDTVSIIDTSTNTIVDTITVGDHPEGVAVNPSGTLLYIVNMNSYTVSVIDTSTNIIIDTISEGFIQPVDILINPSGTIAYVSNHTGHSVSVIDTSTNTVVNSISVAGNPIGIAINPSGTRLYVAADGNYLSVIDTTTNAVVESINLGLWSVGVAVHPFGTMIYAAIYDENDTTYGSISVIDTSTNIVIDSIDVGNLPFGLSVNPSGTHVYVANHSSNTVSVIDTSTNAVVETITVGDGPAGLGNFISTEECMESVPNVIGLSQANAESAITSSDLIVGTITSAHSDTVPEGNVISQSPDSGSLVVTGSAVNIVISLGVSTLDTDNDGLPDGWENQHFGNLTTADDTTDTDGDGLLDIDEYAYETDPNNTDTDGDGDSDGDEVLYGSDPTLITDTLDSHRPYTPVISQISGTIPLRGQIFDVDGFGDPDPGDYLSASEWLISTDQNFGQNDIIFQRILEIKPGAAVDAIEHRQLLMPQAVLLRANSYWIRTLHRDSRGLWSQWSDAVAFNTVAVDPNDQNENGIDDDCEVQGYVDTNNNGIDDSTENIIAFYDAEGGDTIGMRASNGTPGSIDAIPTSDIPTELLPADPMSYGLFSFRIDGLPVDTNNPATADITLFFPDALPADTKWYKYDLAAGTMTDYTSNVVVINGNSVTLTLTDGGSGDADWVVNGIIVDPSGPAVPPTSGGGDPGGGDGGGGGGGCFISTTTN